ncbi:MAG: HAD-IIIA family hydrolase [bacterium]|nr:HAD-IIIA family hydrolase [bacterium]
MNKAVFLDRDGVINEMVYDQEHGLVDSPANPEQVKLKEGIGELVKDLQEKGYLAILFSNQPGMAKKKYTKTLFDQMCKKIHTLLAQQGAFLDAEYYCLHHPEAVDQKYKTTCSCRKPKSGLITKASKEHDLNLGQSWVVGDGINDILVGKEAGCKTILFAKIKEAEYLNLMEKYLNSSCPDYIADDFNGIKMIIQK